MSVGQRMERLRLRHGDSRVQAEKRTGVSRETIRRIEGGETPSTLMHHLERFAAGYGVPLASLVEGRDPNGDFDWFLLQASPAERIQMAIMSVQDRMRLVVRFLADRYPAYLEPVGLAAASGLRPEEVRRVTRGTPGAGPDRQTAVQLLMGISRLTGLEVTWALTGFRNGEPGAAGLISGVVALQVKAGGSPERVASVSALCKGLPRVLQQPGAIGA